MKIQDKLTQQKINLQYKTPSNLITRMHFFSKFSTNPYPWYLWVFDHLHLPMQCRILDLGCGTGELWAQNFNKISQGWAITLCDFSVGMIQAATQSVFANREQFTFLTSDACYLSIQNQTFDVVIANHMLYHISDRNKVFAEIRRVLKPNGYFYCTTNSSAHLQELFYLVRSFDPNTSFGVSPYPFTVEQGGDELSRWFSVITKDTYLNKLIVTETEPLISYILSANRQNMAKDRINFLIKYLKKQFNVQNGRIFITSKHGIFETKLP